MALPRESTFLPTIKCSNCGNEVEISLMGEHLCGTVSPPPETLDRFETSYQPTRSKFSRTAPTVDTGVANRYLDQGQLTPVSHSSNSLDTSPKTPTSRWASTTQDNYIPRIANPDDGHRSPRGYASRPGGYGGFSSQPLEPDQESTRGTESPAKETNKFFQRFNDLTGGIGAFGGQSKTILRQGASKESRNGWDSTSDYANPFSSRKKQQQQSSDADFKKPSQEDESRELSRSETFPRYPSSENDNPVRRPSPPNQRFGHVKRGPSMGPDTSRRPPPRTSLIKQKANTSSLDLEAEFGIDNPYHSSSDSTSSAHSTSSDGSTNPSSRGSTGPTLEPKRYDSTSRPGQQPPRQWGRTPFDSNIARRRDDGGPQLRIDPSIQAPASSLGGLIHSPYNVSPRDQRIDPAVPNDMSDRGGLNYDSSQSLRPAPFSQGSRGARFTSSRGDCKACRLPITGKSISSADGRLSGKYHKACFVCTTCTRPFASAEFYVHQDKPYCNMHYHKLNGSLCGSCQRGIEGQYLEDEVRIKYHPGCFRCLDCDVMLTDGYFEVDGLPYCERDARRRIQRAVSDAGAPVMELDRGSNSYNYQLSSSKAPQTLPNGQYVPNMSSRSRAGFGTDRGLFGGPAFDGRDRFRMNKRMTRIGVM